VGRSALLVLALVLAVAATGTGRAPAAAPTQVSFAAAGDIAFLGAPPRSIFAAVRGTLSSADLAIGNLEGTLGSGGTSKCGSGSKNCFAFQAPAATAALLREAGFDDLNVANNHALDYGPSGQQLTLQALARQKLRWSGRPGEITVVRENGLRIAILGFAPWPWAQSMLDIPAAQKLVRRAEARADLVVAMLHAGGEGVAYQHVPHGTEHFLGEDRGNERQFAHALVNAGVDLVFASGPHVLRGLEVFHGHLIAYSLGNFATAGNGIATEGILGDSAILEATLDSAGRLVSGRLVPVRIVDEAPQPVRGRSAIIPRVNALSREDFGATAVRLAADGSLVLPR